MSFQGYLKTIEEKTGKKPEDFIRLASQKGFLVDGNLKDGLKAGEVTDWLRQEYDLGHGHAMAIWALLKGKRV